MDRYLIDIRWLGSYPYLLYNLVLKDTEDFDYYIIDFYRKDIVLRNLSKRKFEDFRDKSTRSEGSIKVEVLTRLGTNRGYKVLSCVYRPRIRTGANRPLLYQGMYVF